MKLRLTYYLDIATRRGLKPFVGCSTKKFLKNIRVTVHKNALVCVNVPWSLLTDRQVDVIDLKKSQGKDM